MKHLLFILSFLLLTSPVIGQSSKYESVSQCVLQTMKENKLTGNKMFEMVKEECERSLGKVGNGENKKQKVVLFSREVNGVWEWFEDGNENKDIRYVGEIVNGEPNGRGTLTFPEGDKYVGEFVNGLPDGQGTETNPGGRKYVGEWKWGFKHGQGTRTYTNGRKYEGKWKGGKKNGQGTETNPDGTRYVGEWKDGKEHGQGTVTFPDGRTRYVGELKDGKWEGKGTFIFKDGGKYVGEWKDSKWDGQGTFIYPDGRKGVGKWKEDQPWNITYYDTDGNIIEKVINGVEIVQKKQEGVLFGREVNRKVVWFERSKRNVLEVKYKGQIRNNLPNGFGTSNFKGIIYEGDWLNGKYHGKGELILGSGKYKGDKFIGNFINGFKDGVGTYFHKNGSKYKGQWKKDKSHGKGVYTWSDGDKYVGEFKVGKQHGQGTFTFSWGDKYVGEWKDGKPWNGKVYDKNGNITKKYVNGKTIK